MSDCEEILVRAARELARLIALHRATGAHYIHVDSNQGGIRSKPRIVLETRQDDHPPQPAA